MGIVTTLPLPLSGIFGILFGVWVVYKVISGYIQYRRLAHIKGPWLASCTPFWLFYHTCKGDLYLACQRNLRKYGSPLRIAPNQIVTDDPLIQRHMSAPKSSFTRGHWYKGMKFDPRADNLLSMTDEKRHAELRAQLIPGYTGVEVPTLESDISDKISELIHLIQSSHVNQGKAFDFALLANYFTLDVLTKIAWGESLGFLTRNEDIFNYLASSADFFPIMELSSNHPTILSILKSPLLAGAQPKPTDKFGFGAIVGHAHHVVSDRFTPGAKVKHDMIGSFMHHGLSEAECQSETLLQILAGADSTATAIRTTFLHLLTNPYAYGKLVAEIKATVSAGKASSPVITNAEAQALPYLRAVVMEGLRMFMPLNGLASRVPPKGGVTVNGVYIPEGTEVGYGLYSMLRREDLFGHDADTFRPERWTDSEPETIKEMERHHELIFGSGRSGCLGKNIALMELRKLVFELLRTYDLTLVNPFDPIYTRSNSVVVQKNMFLRAYPRQA